MGSLILLCYYLPLWFQIVKGVNPLLSGVMTLPTVISQSLGAIFVGKLVEHFRYVTSLALFEAAWPWLDPDLTKFLPQRLQKSGATTWNFVFQIVQCFLSEYELIPYWQTTLQPMTGIQSFLPLNEIAIATSLTFTSIPRQCNFPLQLAKQFSQTPYSQPSLSTPWTLMIESSSSRAGQH